jgi:rfaE bifunctional protein nucleotidyltransferase chain/domain
MNIWVNGCFDILHSGHIDLLWYAKLYGIENLSYYDAIRTNNLYVGLDSDARVKILKGDGRPINDIETRVKILSNLRMVDEVVIFYNDDDLKYFIKSYNIDYIVVGDQYKDKKVIGSENSKYGVIYYPVDDRSTTNVIEKIKKL